MSRLCNGLTDMHFIQYLTEFVYYFFYTIILTDLVWMSVN